MAKAKLPVSYEQLKQELDTIMLDLQREDITVDQALKHYQRGLELVKGIKAYLQTAENKINELKANFDSKVI